MKSKNDSDTYNVNAWDFQSQDLQRYIDTQKTLDLIHGNLTGTSNFRYVDYGIIS